MESKPRNTSRRDYTHFLKDGRCLSYAVWGEGCSPVVVLLHGWPGSRLAGHLLQEAVHRRGIRLIVPERPGFGRSDPDPNRSVLDFASDLASLTEALGLQKFSVVGYSGGAPYALACAYNMPSCVSGVAIVSGIAPLNNSSRRDFPPHLHLLFSLIERIPRAARIPADLLSLGIKHFPELVSFQAKRSAGAADRIVLLRRQVFQALREEYLEAFHQGGAYVAEEANLYARDWGFPLDALGCDIRLYHGQEDRFIPVSLGQRLAAALPNCSCHVLPNAGHFWILDHFGEVLDDLLGA